MSVYRRGVPDADRRAKLMIYRSMEGSVLDAYLHSATLLPERTATYMTWPLGENAKSRVR